MKEYLFTAVLLGSGASAAFAQGDLDAALEQMAGSLEKDPLSQKLAALTRSDAGKQALRERIDWLLSARIGRIERDGAGTYEDHLFSADENGFLHARPGCAEDFRWLAAEAARAPMAQIGFNRRCADLVARIAGDGEIEKRARRFWTDSEFRRAFFQTRHAELIERDDAGLLAELVTKAIEKRADGTVRLGPAKQEVLDRLKATSGLLDTVKEYEKAWLRVVLAENDPDLRKRAGESGASTFILGRLLRQLNDESEIVIGGVAEDGDDKTLSFNLTLAELMDDVKEGEAMLKQIAPDLDQSLASLAGAEGEEAEFAGFLGNPRLRLLLAERLLDLRRVQTLKAQAVIDEVLADGFEGKAKLIVKKGRYKDDQGVDSPDALEGEYRAVIEGFQAARASYDLIAERCADPATARMFASPEATFVFQQHQARTIEARIASLREEGLKTFTGLYLEKKGDAFAVLPLRAPKIDELARRAAEIQKESEK